MTLDQERLWAEMHMKHLEMLQSVISRMAGSSATIKSSSISVSAALIALSTAIKQSEILFYTIPLIAFFGLLDGYYVRLERAFRDQFNSVRRIGLSEQPTFEISPSWQASHSWLAGVWSWSVWLFYLPLIITFLIIATIMR